ncbi:MAG: pyrroloquinoline quinone biosynthesis peptide chaperone PqqD [Gammaproteobacteria bacterium]|nr:pyrroloquinoline quinone biosynthesis peptide chaperone PqqD [Gammaproteobacteria bacterium]
MTDMTIDSNAKPAIAHGYRLQFEQAQDTWVLLYPEGMIKLNPSAAEILQRCDGERTVNDVITALETAFEQTGLESDVTGFLTVASDQKWVTLG